MRLSLHILADWLEAYAPLRVIQDGSRTIRNVRIFSDEITVTSSNVYVSRTGIDSGYVICMHRNDYIILHSEDENQIMNEIMDAFDFYNNWSDALNRDVAQLTVTQLLEASTSVLQSNLVLANASYYMLAYSYSKVNEYQDPIIPSIADQGIMDLSQILSIEKDPRIRKFIRHCYLQETGGFPLKTAVRNLFTNGRHWGWLIAAAPSHTRGQMDIQDELGDILELWMQTNQETQNRWEQNGVFLSLLEENYKSRDSVEYQLSLLGWQEGDLNWVYSFSIPEISRALFHKVELLAPNVHSCIYQDRLIAILHGSQRDRKIFEEQLAGLLKQSNCRCGCSPAFQNIFALKQYDAFALAAAQYSSQIVTHFQEIALPYTLQILKTHGSEDLIHPALRVLQQYDRHNHTEFYETFRQFLRWERSYSKTCEKMDLHRNTLLYRIARIEKITGLELDDPELRLHLLLSFALDQGAHP